MRLFLLFFITAIITSCASKKHKDISYLPNSSKNSPTLNVFVPKNRNDSLHKVMVFVHGGNWNSGNKSLYSFIGRNFAKKGIVTVIPGYTLSPDADYDKMASQIAGAINWVKSNIGDYSGDTAALFLSGHSAGGHLIALSTMNPRYHVPTNTVSGIVLIDAAGLDMLTFLSKEPPTEKNDYITTWTKDRAVWKKASPITYIDANTPPIMLYLGSKTYPSIKSSNERFLKSLLVFQPHVEPMVLDKKHVGMITQFIWSKSKRYREILKFMERPEAQ